MEDAKRDSAPTAAKEVEARAMSAATAAKEKAKTSGFPKDDKEKGNQNQPGNPMKKKNSRRRGKRFQRWW